MNLIGGIAPVVTGTSVECADALLACMEATDVDGFNLVYAFWPESFEDFVNLVVPDLQKRGRYREAYESGTMRDKLWGNGPRLTTPHPAANLRKSS